MNHTLHQINTGLDAENELRNFRTLIVNKKFAYDRKLDETNPKSAHKIFYNPSILNEFDHHYRKRVEI